MESDMEMSVPASPVRSRSPAILPALDFAPKVKGLREREDVRMKEAEEARVTSDDGEEAADSSDMDMSPPASPVQKPAPISAPTSATPPPASSPPNRGCERRESRACPPCAHYQHHHRSPANVSNVSQTPSAILYRVHAQS